MTLKRGNKKPFEKPMKYEEAVDRVRRFVDIMGRNGFGVTLSVGRSAEASKAAGDTDCDRGQRLTVLILPSHPGAMADAFVASVTDIHVKYFNHRLGGNDPLIRFSDIEDEEPIEEPDLHDEGAGDDEYATL